MRTFLKRFARRSEGNFTLMMAAAMPALMAAAGMAVDVAQLAEAKLRLQGASEAAVLAAFAPVRRGMRERRQIADDMLALNWLAIERDARAQTRLSVWRADGATFMRYEVEGRVKRIVGIAPHDGRLKVRATARYRPGRDSRPVLVPDTGGGKGVVQP